MCTSIPNPEQSVHCIEQHPEKCTCDACRDLHHAAKPIGGYDGEFNAVKRDSQHAKISIGPLSQRQFGRVRRQLAWDHQFGGPTWHTCKDAMTIYLYQKPSKPTIRIFAQLKCAMHEKISIEPRLEKLTVDTRDSTKIKLLLPFGQSQISFTLHEGMTPSEFMAILRQVSAQTLLVPVEQHVLSPIQ